MIFHIYHETLGGHVHMRMFAGPHNGALDKCGDLTMRAEEFWDFMSRFGRPGQIGFQHEPNSRCRAKGGEVGAIGECLQCGAEQGIACLINYSTKG